MLVSVLLLASCVKSTKKQTGQLITQTYEAQDAEELEIKDIALQRASGSNLTTYGAKVNIKKGDKKSVEITMQESLKDEISVSFSSDTLRISGKQNVIYETDDGVTINITGYVFEKLELSTMVEATIADDTLSKDNLEIYESGATIINGNELNGAYFKLEASGASQIKFNTVKVNDALFQLSGASQLRFNTFNVRVLKAEESGASLMQFAGDCISLDLQLSGASQLGKFEFSIVKSKVEISGASLMYATLTEEIKGKASGASTIKYKGNPKIDVELSGASIVKEDSK